MNAMTAAALPKSGADATCSRAASGEALVLGQRPSTITWALPEEVPVALQFNSSPFTVMMATPANLQDFAIGIAIAEGIVKSARDINAVLVLPVENGIAVDIAVDEKLLDTGKLGRRSIEGRTGCGLCGVEDIAAAVKPLQPVHAHTAPTAEAILKAAKALPALQPMNLHNRTVHAAAWVDFNGNIILVREDVGRHNALDKLIGALARVEMDVSSGFVLMTSRCSYELVQKCAFAGIGAIATVSAPTALALDLARASKVYLAALGAGGVVVFNS